MVLNLGFEHGSMSLFTTTITIALGAQSSNVSMYIHGYIHTMYVCMYGCMDGWMNVKALEYKRVEK